MHTLSDKKLVMLRPEDIVVSDHRARKYFDEYELKRLSDSIHISGIISPLAVRKTDGGKYELIAGERRLKAAVMAGLRRVPCTVHKTDLTESAVYSVIENLQRSDLTPFEEAEGMAHIINIYGMSQAELAARLGIAQSTLSNKLRLLNLSRDLRERISAASLTERHARALLRLKAEDRDGVLDRIIAEGMTLNQTESYITEFLTPKPEDESILKPAEKPFRKAAIGDMRLFGNSLAKLIDTLQSAGIDASSKKHETEKYIEYKVRIKKTPPENTAVQLKIC